MMKKQLLKSRKGETLSSESLTRGTVGMQPSGVFQQRTGTEEISDSGLTPGQSPVHGREQTPGEEGLEEPSLVILDACFKGQFCNATTLHSTFERLVRSYQTYLLKLAYQILRNRNAAEDVVQETWRKTFAKLKQQCESSEQVDISRMRAFLIKVVRNTALTYNHHERNFHFVPLETPDGGKDTGELESLKSDRFEQPEFHFLQIESRIGLGKVLQSLPLNYRVVIALRFYYDYSFEETARLLKCPVGTVKCYQNRGLRQLRRAVQDRGVIPEDFDVWSDYSRHDSWLWSHMMRYKDADNIA